MGIHPWPDLQGDGERHVTERQSSRPWADSTIQNSAGLVIRQSAALVVGAVMLETGLSRGPSQEQSLC